NYQIFQLFCLHNYPVGRVSAEIATRKVILGRDCNTKSSPQGMLHTTPAGEFPTRRLPESENGASGPGQCIPERPLRKYPVAVARVPEYDRKARATAPADHLPGGWLSTGRARHRVPEEGPGGAQPQCGPVPECAAIPATCRSWQ